VTVFIGNKRTEHHCSHRHSNLKASQRSHLIVFRDHTTEVEVDLSVDLDGFLLVVAFLRLFTLFTLFACLAFFRFFRFNNVNVSVHAQLVVDGALEVVETSFSEGDGEGRRTSTPEGWEESQTSGAETTSVVAVVAGGLEVHGVNNEFAGVGVEVFSGGVFRVVSITSGVQENVVDHEITLNEFDGVTDFDGKVGRNELEARSSEGKIGNTDSDGVYSALSVFGFSGRIIGVDGVNDVQGSNEGLVCNNFGKSGRVNLLRRSDGNITTNNFDHSKHARVQDTLVIEQTLVGEGVGSGVGLGRHVEEDTSAVNLSGWGFHDVISKGEKRGIEDKTSDGRIKRNKVDSRGSRECNGVRFISGHDELHGVTSVNLEVGWVVLGEAPGFSTGSSTSINGVFCSKGRLNSQKGNESNEAGHCDDAW